MIVELAGAGGAVGAAAWAVRGRSSAVFGPNLWKGPAFGQPNARRALALTFDDGPSESTAALLELLAIHNARATFFQCGANAERLPQAARAVSVAGHEIGNHTQTHPRLYLQAPATVAAEIIQAQRTLQAIHGTAPRWFRAPYGVRWFGMRGAMKAAGLTHVAWTIMARDWVLDGPAVAERCRRGAGPGAILCLHDARELRANPGIRATLEAVGQLLPHLRDEGIELVTLTDLLWPKT